jgi:hypothetical protein
MIKKRHASATTGVDLGYLVFHASGSNRPRRRPHYGSRESGMDALYALRVQSVAANFTALLHLHSSQLANKRFLDPPLPYNHFHRLNHQTYYICITCIRIRISQQHTQTHIHHNTSHIMATGMQLCQLHASLDAPY